MKVLHVSSDYTLGGASRYLLTLLSQPAFQDIDVVLACPEGGPLAEKAARRGIPLFLFDRGDRSFDPRLILSLARLIRSSRFDIIHSHASLSARIAAKLAGNRRIVSTRHTIGMSPPPAGLKLQVTGAAQRLLASRFIAISGAVRERLLEEGVPASRIDTIHNGVDVETIEEAAAQSTGRVSDAPDTRVVGTLGRLSPEKGHENLVRCFPRVLECVPEATLVVAGHGPERARLEVVARRAGISSKVAFTGYQENAPLCLKAFDVFVMPSLSEGLGLALLEAMALGRPVVATAAGGIPEIVTSEVNGLLVPPDDTEGLASAIVRLLSDPALAARLGQAGRNTVVERFSARSMAEKTVAVYRRLLDEVQRPVGGDD